MSRLRLATVALVALAAAVPATLLASHDRPAVAAETPCIPTFPNVPLPAFQLWTGAAPPIGKNTVVIVQRHAQFPADYVAYVVEWKLQSIPKAYVVPSGKLPLFVDSSLLATILIRHPPPPPPVQGDWLLRDAYMADDSNTVFPGRI